MAKQDTDQEPSIEEILNSIRQIISDDEDSGAAAQEDPAPEEETEPDPYPDPDPIEDSSVDDIIELTDRVEEQENTSFEEEGDAAAFDIEMQESPLPDFTPEPEPIIEAAPPPPPRTAPKPAPRPAPVVDSEPDSVLTSKAEDAAFGAFSELARKTAIEYGGITVEEIVRSELKPMLRDWLDRHLPSMIERLVQEELERVSKRVIGD